MIRNYPGELNGTTEALIRGRWEDQSEKKEETEAEAAGMCFDHGAGGL